VALTFTEQSEGALVSASPIGENTTSDAAGSLSVARILCQSFVVLKSCLANPDMSNMPIAANRASNQSRPAEHICQ
jgi:hypothetical protein